MNPLSGVRIPPRPMRARTRAGKLRIAVLSDALEDRNGVDAYYRDLVEHLAQRGHAVEFMQPAKAGSTRLLSVPMPGDPKQRIYFPNPVVLSRRMRALQPQVILAATPGPFGLYGLYAARRLNARLIAGFHTHLEGLAGLYWSRILGGAGGRYLALLNRLLFRHAEVTVVNAQTMMERARRLGAAEVALLGTPLGRRFLETPLKPLGASIRHVLFAGRLAPEKNLEDVIEAAARLPHIRFSVAGDGPLGEWVARRAGELPNLTHLGWVPRSRIVDALDAADALVLPSHIEAFGTIALEAMARRRLVVVSAHCGILNWPTLANAIYAVRADESLATAILRLERAAPYERRRKAELARRAAQELNAATLDGWLGMLSGELPVADRP